MAESQLFEEPRRQSRGDDVISQRKSPGVMQKAEILPKKLFVVLLAGMGRFQKFGKHLVEFYVQRGPRNVAPLENGKVIYVDLVIQAAMLEFCPPRRDGPEKRGPPRFSQRLRQVVLTFFEIE